jgi:hypothetical protein
MGLAPKAGVAPLETAYPRLLDNLTGAIGAVVCHYENIEAVRRIVKSCKASQARLNQQFLVVGRNQEE